MSRKAKAGKVKDTEMADEAKLGDAPAHGTKAAPKDPLTGVALVAPKPAAAVAREQRPFRVRACYVMRGVVVSHYEAHDTLKDAVASAKVIKEWKRRAPLANGIPMMLSQLDVDKLERGVWKLQQRTKVEGVPPVAAAPTKRKVKEPEAEVASAPPTGKKRKAKEQAPTETDGGEG